MYAICFSVAFLMFSIYTTSSYFLMSEGFFLFLGRSLKIYQNMPEYLSALLEG
jgi:hypothetical protein